jgi:hypothetical protein
MAPLILAPKASSSPLIDYPFATSRRNFVTVQRSIVPVRRIFFCSSNIP